MGCRSLESKVYVVQLQYDDAQNPRRCCLVKTSFIVNRTTHFKCIKRAKLKAMLCTEIAVLCLECDSVENVHFSLDQTSNRKAKRTETVRRAYDSLSTRQRGYQRTSIHWWTAVCCVVRAAYRENCEEHLHDLTLGTMVV